MEEGESYPDPVSDINVTPLIDVLMCLLIIFMVGSEPPPKQKQPIAIPKDSLVQSTNDPNATLLISIDANGAITLGKTPIADRSQLVTALQENEKAQTEGRVAVKADGKVPYGSVIDVMAAAREAGVANVGIASERL